MTVESDDGCNFEEKECGKYECCGLEVLANKIVNTSLVVMHLLPCFVYSVGAECARPDFKSSDSMSTCSM